MTAHACMHAQKYTELEHTGERSDRQLDDVSSQKIHYTEDRYQSSLENFRGGRKRSCAEGGMRSCAEGGMRRCPEWNVGVTHVIGKEEGVRLLQGEMKNNNVKKLLVQSVTAKSSCS